MAFEALGAYAAETGFSLLAPLLQLWYSVIQFIPGLVAAVIIILVGWCIAWLLGYVVHNLMLRCNIDRWMEKNNLTKSVGGVSVSSLVATVVKWFVFVTFLVPAIDFLRLGSLSILLANFVSWLPHLIIAVTFVIIGLIVGDFAADKVRHSNTKGLRTLGAVVRGIIIVFASVVALQELGVQIRIAESTFLVLLTGVVVAAALALGIGFGLGLKDEAHSMVKDWRKKYL